MVKVQNTTRPAAQVIAKAKGDHRKVESEGRRRQTPAPTNRNHIRQYKGIGLLKKPKPNSRTEPCTATGAEIRVEDCVLTRGDLTDEIEGDLKLAVRGQQKP